MNNWQASFKDWMKKNLNISDSSIGHYSSAVKNILSWANMDITDIISTDGLKLFMDTALNNPTFQERNSIGNNMYGVALHNFEKFIKGTILSTLYIYPETLLSNSLYEGERKTIVINAYERNPIARKKCIQIHGDKCAVCGFSFADTYGQDYIGIIHVHHLKPLSEISEEYVVDPIKDLIPVCPNCHLILHSKPNGVYSIDEVKALLIKQNKPIN
ncbi:hypothetical protein Ana3638_20855 [Anaerocolumna sedimenticola]|uniref:HNH domain-containing protein n=1 Tax=Anaerocolumna sedimenticola TaxID=2696063 RepID=A0A6P1TT80_9FIRM|nr:HNH endonuclease [Anaerocolumna sedimenticola]QHQ62926.1 hypothetical protein Ana3638_20855 [Anaerocolumna sedimenticola]